MHELRRERYGQVPEAPTHVRDGYGTCAGAPGARTAQHVPGLRPSAETNDLVRAENPVHGSDQQACHPSRLTVMITGHVPTVRLPPDHADRHMAAAVPARGDVADRRDLDPAPPARRAATAAAGPPEPELGGPGTARDAARRDTESAAPRAEAAGHSGHDPALAPRCRPPPLGR